MLCTIWEKKCITNGRIVYWRSQCVKISTKNVEDLDKRRQSGSL
jgi:hypothetical protein